MGQEPPFTDSELSPTAAPTSSRALAFMAMGLGIGSLVLCIIAPVSVPAGIAAVVTGGIALAGHRPGRKQAWIGVVCGLLAIVLSVLVFLWMLSGLSRARQVARMTMSMQNVKQIGNGLLAYAADYRDQLPEPGVDLTQRLGPYIKSPRVLESPNDPSVRPGYIYVPRGRYSRADPTDVLVYENPAVPALEWVVLYVDGHVELKSREELEAIVAGVKGAMESGK